MKRKTLGNLHATQLIRAYIRASYGACFPRREDASPRFNLPRLFLLRGRTKEGAQMSTPVKHQR